VQGITGSILTASFTYDANGNETAGETGKTLTYTSFNKPATITEGSNTVTFSHDTDHQRFKQVAQNGSTTLTTRYVSAFGILAEFVMGSGGSNQWNEYLFVYGEMVGERVNVINGAKTKFWFHKDHLGSMAALTNGTIGDPNLGSVVERDSYDAWGRQRHTNGTDDAVLTGSITSTVTRGYTGQEELADVSLIHYNGRVYDPLIARFTSPDPVVGQPESSQGWNRYAYVGNNPLAFTDPNGYCGFFCVVSHVFNPIQHFNDVLAITRAVYSVPYLGQLLNIATVAVASYFCGPCAIGVAAAVSSLQAGVTTGKIGEAFKAGAIAAAEAAAFEAVGTATDFHGGTLSDVASRPGDFALNVAGHAAIGCVGAAASGGNCGAGAAGAGFGAIAAPVLGTVFPHPHDNFADLMGGTLASAGVGGLGSIAGGGKFENGAVTGAFGYLFNSVQYTGSVTGTAALFVLGANFSFGGGISVPDSWTDWGEYQVLLNGELNGMVGGGAFLGIGATVGRGTSGGAIPLFNADLVTHGEFDIGAGPAAGASVDFPWHDVGNPTFSLGTVKGGAGFGLWLGGGVGGGATVATPTLRQLGDFIHFMNVGH
jgi:RHS repeat-associated protein